MGGEILPIEVTLMPGKGALRLTGKLGDVMQESAHAAMSFVRSRAEQFGIARDFNRKLDVHIHVPEGAIPKDGPSAGITMCTALVSALTRMPVRRDVAMTGEITLRGKVLPIGGLKEKLLAAHRIGVTTVILPRENEKDLADVPKNVLEGMQVQLVDHVDEVLKIALLPPDTPPTQVDGGRGRRRAGHGARRHDPLKRRSPRPRGARRPPATTILKHKSVTFAGSAASPDQFPRDGLPEVAFLGRSNVGKSSLLNALAGVRGLARVSSDPGRTRLVNFFRVSGAEKPGGAGRGDLYLVDLPGYGYVKASRDVRESFERIAVSYLADREPLRLCVFIVDARHEPERPRPGPARLARATTPCRTSWPRTRSTRSAAARRSAGWRRSAAARWAARKPSWA